MKPLCLVVMDGFGIKKPSRDNAITLANPVNFNNYFTTFPSTFLEASGESVGLPKGQMGGSEVGHLTMGVGAVLNQDLTKINNSNFGKVDNINSFLKNCNALHLIGLLSDGGIHSHIEHLFKLIKAASLKKKNIYIHIITDGRDADAQSALKYIAQLEKFIKTYTNVKIASVGGRFYAMDRERIMERTEQGYNAVVNAKAIANYNTPAECVNANYAKGVFDEFIVPATINGGMEISGGDGLLFYNFRSDRTKQFCNKLLSDKPAIQLATMTNYGLDKTGVTILFTEDKAEICLGKIFADNNIKQLRISETTKYPHVTYFFNGGSDVKFASETRIEVPSKNVKTFDLAPEMSTPKVVELLTNSIAKKEYGFYMVNLSNADMVGHCAKLDKTIEAIKVVDESIKKITDAMLAIDGTVIITADHGNAEEGLTTAHTTSPVPFIILQQGLKCKLRKGGSLADVAPTILDILGINKPNQMTGKSLIIK